MAPRRIGWLPRLRSYADCFHAVCVCVCMDMGTHGYPASVTTHRVHPLLFWPIALVVVLGAATLLTAPIHDALLDAGWISPPDAPDDPVDPETTEERDIRLNKTFLQVFRRLLLGGLAVLFFWWFRPWRGGLLRYGLRPVRPQLRSTVRPFLTMSVILFAVLAGQMLTGWLTWEDPPRVGKFAVRVVRFTAAGFLIAFIEEWFFRGWLGEFASKRHGPRLAVFLPALAYAIVHAFRPTTLDHAVSHDAAGALDALAGWFAFLFDLQAFGPAFVGLLLFAYLLTALYRRHGSLWPAIGAHAAAIMVIFSYGALTDRDPARTWAGTRLLYDGPVVWALLAAGAWWLWPRDPGRNSPDSTESPEAQAGSSSR